MRRPGFLFIYIMVPMMCLVICNQSALAQWQPFTLRDGYIVIDVEIDGHEASAILDSGASSNMISSAFVRKYGQDFTKSGKVDTKGFYGKKKQQFYNNVPVKLFGVDVQFHSVPEVLRLGADLRLGGVFFQDIIIQIDYPNSRLRLLSKKSVDLNKQANVRMERASGGRFPAIEVEHNGVTVWLIFDTGNPGGIVVDRSFATANGWLDDKTDVTEQTSFGLLESSTSLNFYIDALKIGPYELKHVSVTVPSEDHMNNFGRYMDESMKGTRIKRGVQVKGLIGNDVLKHFIVTIDYMGYQVNLYAP